MQLNEIHEEDRAEWSTHEDERLDVVPGELDLGGRVRCRVHEDVEQVLGLVLVGRTLTRDLDFVFENLPAPNEIAEFRIFRKFR